MTYKDPTRIRISDQFLLSDFLLCDSVARKEGHANKFNTNDKAKIAELQLLAVNLEKLIDVLGPLRISYSYLSPELSNQIVKYQDPNKPSYHRYDIGAAADIYFGALYPEMAPIEVAWLINELVIDSPTIDNFSYSRLITYSESQHICFATSTTQHNRKAMYENRYNGKKGAKPIYIKYPDNIENRKRFIKNQTVPTDYIGQGYPSYHGGGRLQYHHMKLSKSFTVLDFLYCKKKVHSGVSNRPPFVGSKEVAEKWKSNAASAANVMEYLAGKYRQHISIISAYDSNDPDRNWLDRFTLNVVPPTSLHWDDVAHELGDNIQGIKVEVLPDSIYIEGSLF